LSLKGFELLAYPLTLVRLLETVSV